MLQIIMEIEKLAAKYQIPLPETCKKLHNLMEIDTQMFWHGETLVVKKNLRYGTYIYKVNGGLSLGKAIVELIPAPTKYQILQDILNFRNGAIRRAHEQFKDSDMWAEEMVKVYLLQVLSSSTYLDFLRACKLAGFKRHKTLFNAAVDYATQQPRNINPSSLLEGMILEGYSEERILKRLAIS